MVKIRAKLACIYYVCFLLCQTRVPVAVGSTKLKGAVYRYAKLQESNCINSIIPVVAFGAHLLTWPGRWLCMLLFFCVIRTTALHNSSY